MSILSRLLGAPATKTAAQEMDAVEVQGRLDQQPAPLLIDVREPQEYREAHIEGARLIPLGELPGFINELPQYREIICVCRSGNRSARATRFLNDAGFKAINLRGGMLAWGRAALPVRRGDPA